MTRSVIRDIIFTLCIVNFLCFLLVLVSKWQWPVVVWFFSFPVALIGGIWVLWDTGRINDT